MEERLRFSIAPGAAGPLAAAIRGASSPSHPFLLTYGDLNTMGRIAELLRNRGFEVRYNNVYPSIMESDVVPVLTLFWQEKVTGWYHYRSEMVRRGICTKEQFDAALQERFAR